MAKLLGEKSYQWSDSSRILENVEIGDYEHLAVRVEAESFAKIIAESMPKDTTTTTGASKASSAKAAGAKSSMDSKTETTSAASSTTETPGSGAGEIDFEEFAKIDLRIAKIIEAEEIKEADKLLRLKVSLGDMGERQIIAGIKSAYKAEDLVGRLTVIVANLKPRKMKFGMSEGMVLAAGPGGKDLFIMSPDSGAQPGQKVK